MSTDLVNSADSHVLEPDDLFVSELPAKYRHLAPRTVKDGNVETIYINDEFFRRDPTALMDRYRPPGASDPVVRLQDLDSQGIWAELIFPSTGLWLGLLQDRGANTICNRVYNDWLLSEIMSASPRFVGVACLPTCDVSDAIEELERVAGAGYQAVCLPPTAPSLGGYNLEVWDPLWAAIEESGLHLCFHIAAGDNPQKTKGRGGAIANYVETFFPAQRTLAHFVAAGTLDRHPKLHIMFIEAGASWLSTMMERMDECYLQTGDWVRPKLELLPSEYVRRQVHASFQHDKVVLRSLDITGVDAVMWGSDYPHLEGTFPNTQGVINDVFAGSSAEIRCAITWANFAKYFRIPLPTAAQ